MREERKLIVIIFYFVGDIATGLVKQRGINTGKTMLLTGNEVGPDKWFINNLKKNHHIRC